MSYLHFFLPYIIRGGGRGCPDHCRTSLIAIAIYGCISVSVTPSGQFDNGYILYILTTFFDHQEMIPKTSLPAMIPHLQVSQLKAMMSILVQIWDYLHQMMFLMKKHQWNQQKQRQRMIQFHSIKSECTTLILNNT